MYLSIFVSMYPCISVRMHVSLYVSMYVYVYSLSEQFVAVCAPAVCFCVLQCAAVCCSVLQCVLLVLVSMWGGYD